MDWNDYFKLLVFAFKLGSFVVAMLAPILGFFLLWDWVDLRLKGKSRD